MSEHYESRVDGLEQSFAFARRPHGDGDLVVRPRVASELAAPLGEHEALSFTLHRSANRRAREASPEKQR